MTYFFFSGKPILWQIFCRWVHGLEKVLIGLACTPPWRVISFISRQNVRSIVLSHCTDYGCKGHSTILSHFCKIVHVWHTCWVLNDPNKIWAVHRVSNMRGCPMPGVISAVAILLPFTPQKLVLKIISRVGLIKLNWNVNAEEQKITNWILINFLRQILWHMLVFKFWSATIMTNQMSSILRLFGLPILLYCTHLLLLESHFIIPIIIAYVPTILCWVCEA